MRVTEGMIVGPIAAGVSIEALPRDYPYLEPEGATQRKSWAAPLEATSFRSL
jgi:uncharacterized protein (DUF433 family)